MRTAAGTLLSHQVQPVLAAVVDLEFGRRARCLREHSVIAQTLAVLEELVLQLLGDISLDDDIVGILPGEE